MSAGNAEPKIRLLQASAILGHHFGNEMMKTIMKHVFPGMDIKPLVDQSGQISRLRGVYVSRFDRKEHVLRVERK